MTYLVEIQEADRVVWEGVRSTVVTRPVVQSAAFETFEGATNAAHELVHAAYRKAYPILPRGLGGEHSDAQRAHRWHSIAVSRLELGQPIGPLPGGSYVTVHGQGA